MNPMSILWHKYHALRNDFIVVDAPKGRDRKYLGRLAKEICDRHTGVGADGLLVASISKNAPVANVFNADGSWAEMSGNGARIVAFHAARQRNRAFSSVRIGEIPIAVTVKSRSSSRAIVSGEIGVPNFDTQFVGARTKKRAIIQAPVRISGLSIPMTLVSIGNPHAVLFVDSFDFEWPSLGKLIEDDRTFPNRINVEFVRVIRQDRLEVRLWERGVGITDSSGTGAAAALAAAVVTGRAKRACSVISLAGILKVDWSEQTGAISIEGPVNFVASGSFDSA